MHENPLLPVDTSVSAFSSKLVISELHSPLHLHSVFMTDKSTTVVRPHAHAPAK